MRPFSVYSLAALLAGAAASISAQTPKTPSFDRRVIPTPGKNPELHIPAWTTTALSNGAKLVVASRHSLPLVSFQLNFIGGTNQYDPDGKSGVGSFVASMLSEGTTHRTGDQISNELQLLGTSVVTQINGESGRMLFESTKDKFAPALAIVADMVENPTFPQAAVDRVRSRTIVSLT